MLILLNKQEMSSCVGMENKKVALLIPFSTTRENGQNFSERMRVYVSFTSK